MRIAVVGGGAVGSLAHYLLRTNNVDSMLFEKSGLEKQGAVCTGIISDRLLDLYPFEATECRFRTVEQVSLTVRDHLLYAGTLPTDRVWVLQREEFERRLLSLARSVGGVHLHTRVVAVEASERGVKIHIVGSEGCAETVSVDLLVAACGYSQAVGLGLRQPTIQNEVVAAQTVTPWVSNDLTVRVHVAPGDGAYDFAWVVPRGDRLALVGELRNRLQSKKCTFPLLQGLVPDSSHPLDLRKKIFCLGLSRSTLPRTVLLGEAGGHVKPLTGGGLGFGAIAAHLLVESILAGCEPSVLLRNFNRSVQRSLYHNIVISMYLRKSVPFVCRGRQLVLVANALERTHLPTLDFDFHARAFAKGLRSVLHQRFSSAIRIQHGETARPYQNYWPGSPGR